MSDIASEMWYEEQEQYKTSWDKVKEDIDNREKMGYTKYGKYLSVNTDEDMLNHLYEELLDATVYIKTLLMQRSEHEV